MILPCRVSPCHSHNFPCLKARFCVGIGMRKTMQQFFVPEVDVPVVLKLIHDTPIAGHQGREGIVQSASRVYYWPSMRKDIAAYAARYISCAEHKG